MIFLISDDETHLLLRFIFACLSHTLLSIAVNGLNAGAAKFTTVGKAIRDVEIKIAEDGEILCKGI